MSLAAAKRTPFRDIARTEPARADSVLAPTTSPQDRRGGARREPAPTPGRASQRSASSRSRSASPACRATQATVRRARCQTSWWSTSATDAPTRFCELLLRRADEHALLLQRVRLGEAQLHGEDARRNPRPRKALKPCRAAVLAARRGGRRFVERRPLDLARLVGLEDVAFLHVVEAVEQDAALEALGDLADVVLEAPQLRDRRVVDDRAVADDAHLRVPADDAAS